MIQYLLRNLKKHQKLGVILEQHLRGINMEGFYQTENEDSIM